MVCGEFIHSVRGLKFFVVLLQNQLLAEILVPDHHAAETTAERILLAI